MTAHGGKRKGAGRKPKHKDLVQVAARIPRLDVKDMDREAKKRKLSRNDIMIERCARK